MRAPATIQSPPQPHHPLPYLHDQLCPRPNPATFYVRDALYVRKNILSQHKTESSPRYRPDPFRWPNGRKMFFPSIFHPQYQHKRARPDAPQPAQHEFPAKSAFVGQKNRRFATTASNKIYNAPPSRPAAALTRPSLILGQAFRLRPPASIPTRHTRRNRKLSIILTLMRQKNMPSIDKILIKHSRKNSQPFPCLRADGSIIPNPATRASRPEPASPRPQPTNGSIPKSGKIRPFRIKNVSPSGKRFAEYGITCPSPPVRATRPSLNFGAGIQVEAARVHPNAPQPAQF